MKKKLTNYTIFFFALIFLSNPYTLPTHSAKQMINLIKKTITQYQKYFSPQYRSASNPKNKFVNIEKLKQEHEELQSHMNKLNTMAQNAENCSPEYFINEYGKSPKAVEKKLKRIQKRLDKAEEIIENKNSNKKRNKV